MIFSLFFKSIALESVLDIILLRLPITKEKKQTPKSIQIMARICSASVYEVMSPYPTVLIVVIAQYIEAIYYVPTVSSKYPERTTQVSGLNFEILALNHHNQAAIWTHNVTVVKTIIIRRLRFLNAMNSITRLEIPWCLPNLVDLPSLINFYILNRRYNLGSLRSLIST